MKSSLSLSPKSETQFKSKPSNKKFSLKVKATIIGIAIGVIPVTLIGTATYLFVRSSFSRQIDRFKELQAISMIDKAEEFILERYNNIEVLSNLFIFRDQSTIAPEEQGKKLTEYLKIYGVYDSIAFVDIDGNNIATSQGRTIANHQQEDYFQAIISDQQSKFSSQPRRDPTTGKISIYFSAPVTDDRSDRLVGVLVSRMPVQHLEKILEEYGISGSTYHLMDREGKIFVTNNLQSLGTVAYKHSPNFTQLREQKKPSPFKIYEKVEERRVIGGYAPFQTTKETRDLGWDGFLATDLKVAYADLERLSFGIVGLTFLMAIATGSIAATIAKRTIKPITEAAEAVEKIGQGDLDTRLQVRGSDELATLTTNINLMADRIEILLREVSEKAAKLQIQNERVVTENDVLQEDISYILELVCALESGDLTVEAKVNERISGLIADTLNRLIGKLNNTVSIALTTAKEVTSKAEALEKAALDNSQQVQKQTQLVTEVQQLMVNVNSFSQNAAEQALIADEAVEEVRQAVERGHRELKQINAAIENLAEGTEQIGIKTNAIGDFIELAARFTKEQKILAAQTRVLALNASMLASRAAKEQEQSSITKEFQALAKQVNDLALRTDRSLILLKQKSESIQSVGSRLDRDVREIGELVDRFTRGAKSSDLAFEEIDLATQKVGNIGQKVTQSSWDIAEATQVTLDTISEITAVAAKTEEKISVTRSQSYLMEEIANDLLELINFFKLSSNEQKIDRQVTEIK